MEKGAFELALFGDRDRPRPLGRRLPFPLMLSGRSGNGSRWLFFAISDASSSIFSKFGCPVLAIL
eukprot:SAG11_NODE_9909_length_870_cov_3.722438_1_plen_64_part_10